MKQLSLIETKLKPRVDAESILRAFNAAESKMLCSACRHQAAVSRAKAKAERERVEAEYRKLIEMRKRTRIHITLVQPAFTLSA